MQSFDPLPTLKLQQLAGRRLQIVLSGDWTAGARRPPAEPVIQALHSKNPPQEICFDATGLRRWDSLLLTFLAKVLQTCAGRSIAADRSGLPQGVLGLLDLADAAPEREGVRRTATGAGFLEGAGKLGIGAWNETVAMTAFIGEAAIAFGNFLLGRAHYRRVDLWLLIQECGANALPIVTLISVLVGMILAFVGSVQLANYGAQAYIADMVGKGMSREMGALMTAIIMTGRTGAAFAAQLGSMQANDEIDALKTMGFSEMEFLVLPRMLALIVMMPLLCVYSDLMGMAGGALVSYGLFDISVLQYSQHIQLRLVLGDFAVGLGKSAVFGLLVATAGCMRGVQCGRSSQAVGLATTSAVVTGIVMIVVSDAVMTFIVTTMKW